MDSTQAVPDPPAYIDTGRMPIESVCAVHVQQHCAAPHSGTRRERQKTERALRLAAQHSIFSYYAKCVCVVQPSDDACALLPLEASERHPQLAMLRTEALPRAAGGREQTRTHAQTKPACVAADLPTPARGRNASVPPMEAAAHDLHAQISLADPAAAIPCNTTKIVELSCHHGWALCEDDVEDEDDMGASVHGPAVFTDFGHHCEAGDRITAKDRFGNWCLATVLKAECDVAGKRLLVHFMGWKARWDEWIEVASGRLREAKPQPPKPRRQRRGKAKRSRPPDDHLHDCVVSSGETLAVATAAAVREAALGLRSRAGATTTQSVRPSTHGNEAKGRRVRVLFDRAHWYEGMVSDFNAVDQQHFVTFDDGDVEWLQLDEEEEAGQLEWITDERAREVVADEASAAAQVAEAEGKLQEAAGSAEPPTCDASLPPLLHQWKWSDNGKLSGKVYGKKGYRDGTLITTSAVQRSQRFNTHAVTESGTIYLLGTPAGAAEPTNDEKRGVIAQRLGGFAGSGTGAVSGATPKMSLSDGSVHECSICRESCAPSASDWDVTPCKHAFHFECINAWVTRRASALLPPTCPDCRHPLSSSRWRLFG